MWVPAEAGLRVSDVCVRCVCRAGHADSRVGRGLQGGRPHSSAAQELTSESRVGDKDWRQRH